eukprot:gb/GECG01011106.1/.p1 GENE.gb/GECG01011106.1/~~gb/GECG01011106.1/.p1  ORF type:complete len:189 (+),score=25.86 gb/GECG01011106.1/:1-567(+)
MPPPIPSAPIGIPLLRASSSVPKLSISLFCDLICPFSAKQFLVVQRELVPHLKQTNPGEVDIKLYFVPQPWHPQSGTLVEGALSVQKEKEEATATFVEHLYDQRENFTDDKLYDSSRREIYHKLADIAEQSEVSKDAFLKNLELTEGGTHVTLDLKFYAKLVSFSCLSPYFLLKSARGDLERYAGTIG